MAEDTRVGTAVAGYRIQSVLGRGGMGVVYLAEDTRLSRKVALKLLVPALADSERFLDRFLRETKVAASIDHPNIVPIYDAGEADGVLYLAMRYVEGTDLHRLIHDEGPLDVERVVAIVAQVAAALDTAHGRGLVHRDVKPSNVLVVPRSSPAGTDHVYLSDFGLTKRALSVSGLTETGQLIGTIDYVAPEQIKGDPVDGRADIYSLGCIVYECLAGEVPFPRDLEVAVLWAHVQTDTPSVAAVRKDVPVEMDGAIARAMAKTPDDRTPTGETLVADLRSALGYEGARPRRPITRRRRAGRRRLAALGAAAAILAVGAFILIRGGGGNATVPGPNTVARIDTSSGEFDQVVPVGNQPNGVAVGGGSVWVINQGDQTVSRIDPTRSVAEAAKSTLGTPTGIAFGEGAAWITNGFGSQNGNAQVVRVNPADDSVESAFASPNAHAIVVAFGSIWLANPLQDRVIRYDPTTGERTETITFDGGSSPSFLAVGDGAASGVWVVNPLANGIARIDPDTNHIEKFGVDQPTAVAASGDSVWVTSDANDTISRLDAETGNSTTTLILDDGVPNGPSNIVVAPDGVWVSSSLTPVVARIDPATNTVVDTLAVANGSISDALAVDQDGNVWVTVHRP